MSSLGALRFRLRLLRRVRNGVRAVVAAALVIAVVSGVGLALFGLDRLFEPWVSQRLMLLAGVAFLIGAVVIAAVRPLIRRWESDAQIALSYERSQNLDSDLVAALQFDREAEAFRRLAPGSGGSEVETRSPAGSSRLRHAVVDYVQATPLPIPIWPNLLAPRGLAAVLTAVVLIVPWVAFAAMTPDHLAIFVRRMLAFSPEHYPTATRLASVTVGADTIWTEAEPTAHPRTTRHAADQPLVISVLVHGQRPDRGTATLRSVSGGGVVTVDLLPVGDPERRERLARIRDDLLVALEGPTRNVSRDRLRAMAADVANEIPEAAAELAEAASRTDAYPSPSTARPTVQIEADPPTVPTADGGVTGLGGDQPATPTVISLAPPMPASLVPIVSGVVDRLDARLASWDQQRPSQTLYSATLERLGQDADLQIRLGDAWTEPARLTAVARPRMRVRLEITPPPYAAGRPEIPAGLVEASQVAVLIGSDVVLEVEPLGDRTLASVIAEERTESEVRRWRLVPTEGSRTFRLPLEAAALGPPRGPSASEPTDPASLSATGSPLAQITQERVLTLEAVDRFGFLAESERIVVRPLPDRSPVGSLTLASRVVLPTATPRVGVTASDDFGLAEVRLRLRVERSGSSDTAVGSDLIGEEGPPSVTESPRTDISLVSQPENGPMGAAEAPRPATTASTASDRDATSRVPPPPPASAASELPERVITIWQSRREAAPPVAWRGETTLPLPELNVRKGDLVQVAVEVTDERGREPGQTWTSPPVAIEISDAAGVLAAVLRADEEAENRLTEALNLELNVDRGR